MKRKTIPALLALCLLAGCAAPTPAETPAPTPAAEVTPTPTPTPEPTEDPFAWVEDQEQEWHYSNLEGISHMPLDQLPQEVLDSLELTAESGFNGFYPDDWGFRRQYQGPGLEVWTSAPTAAYLENLRRSFEESGEYYNLTDSCLTPEEFEAYIDGEENREWIVHAVVSDDYFATVKGLKVGMTLEEAEAAGYPLRKQCGFGGGFGPTLQVGVEDGIVASMTTWWDLGRYIGKFFEL